MNSLITEKPVPSFAWPGGYPIYYICADMGILCANCVNEEKEVTFLKKESSNPQWLVVSSQINWEDNELYCDHCGKKIDCAY